MIKPIRQSRGQTERRNIKVPESVYMHNKNVSYLFRETHSYLSLWARTRADIEQFLKLIFIFCRHCMISFHE